jgi:gamma-glutamylputrescine oxidase
MISIWEQESFLRNRDVVIIGSGFSGLWIAYFLKQKHPHLSILVVDKALIPFGASTRNAGFACFGSPTEILHDIKTQGLESSLQLVEQRFKGIEIIRNTFHENEIDYIPCGGFELLQQQQQYVLDELLTLNNYLQPITNTNNTYTVDNNISQYQFSHTSYIVKNSLEAGIHSGKLLEALSERCKKAGIDFLYNINVTAVQQNSIACIIHNTAYDIKTKTTIVTTNGFATTLLPQLQVQPARGQVIVTAPIENLPWQGTFHYDEGYYYFRNIGNRILLGGARNKFLAQENTHIIENTANVVNHLKQFLQETIIPWYKQPIQIDYQWAGIMGIGNNKIPFLGKTAPNTYHMVKLSGMGVALAPYLAKTLVNSIIDPI